MEDKSALLDAVNTLVFDDNAQRYYKTMIELGKLPPELMAGLTGPAKVLAPLLAIYRDDREAFDNIMDLVDRKRAARGWEPLSPQKPPGFDRNEYQREFMRQKRDRERRAVEIENTLRHDRDKLIGNPRLEFMRIISAGWKRRRDELLTAARASHGGTLSKEQVQGLLDTFWRQIDTELDRQEEDAMRKLRRH